MKKIQNLKGELIHIKFQENKSMAAELPSLVLVLRLNWYINDI